MLLASKAELEVLKLLVLGLPTKDISTVLGREVDTVKNQIVSLRRKNRVNTTTQLVVSHYQLILDGEARRAWTEL